MTFYSTNNRNIKISLENAVMGGLAEDGGLYMPEKIPQLSDMFFKNMNAFSFPELK